MKKTIIIILFLILLAILLLSIAKNHKENIVIYINSEKVVLDLENTEKNIDLNTLNTENDTIITNESKIKIKVNSNTVKPGESLNLGKLKLDRQSYIEISNIASNKKININTLPSTFPEYDVAGESEYDGDYYLSTYSFEYDDIHYIFKLNKVGEIVYYKKTNMVSFDFKKIKNKNDEIRYTYLEATETNFEGVTSLLPCDLVVLDENYNEINRIKYLNSDGSSSSLENHTYMYLDDNHYILTTYRSSEKELKEYDNQTMQVFDCVIEEIKDGEILWEFNSGDYEELYSYSTKSSYPDYIHINSMSIDESDGNLLCSFRNIDSVLKIDRNTGELIWILGGKGDEFGLTETQKFSKQHSIVYIGDNTILLYDNGNAKYRSRMLKIKLDENTKTITEYKEYDLNVYAYMMGSVQEIDKENETYLICYGGGQYNKYSVQEIEYSTGTVKFQFTFLNNRMIYNVNKIDL